MAQRATSVEVAGPRRLRSRAMVRLFWMGSPPMARSQPRECWRRWRRVTLRQRESARPAAGSRSGSKSRNLSSRRSLPASASLMMAMAVTVFEILPMRMRVRGFMGRWAVGSAKPTAPAQLRRPLELVAAEMPGSRKSARTLRRISWAAAGQLSKDSGTWGKAGRAATRERRIIRVGVIILLG